MSENIAIDPEKVVHEENYKVNLGDEIPDVKEVVSPTQINTEESHVTSEPIIVGQKPIMTDVRIQY
jgi:hypothetical protein